jgi:hypothetical protein
MMKVRDFVAILRRGRLRAKPESQTIEVPCVKERRHLAAAVALSAYVGGKMPPFLDSKASERQLYSFFESTREFRPLLS